MFCGGRAREGGRSVRVGPAARVDAVKVPVDFEVGQLEGGEEAGLEFRGNAEAGDKGDTSAGGNGGLDGFNAAQRQDRHGGDASTQGLRGACSTTGAGAGTRLAQNEGAGPAESSRACGFCRLGQEGDSGEDDGNQFVGGEKGQSARYFVS